MACKWKKSKQETNKTILDALCAKTNPTNFQSYSKSMSIVFYACKEFTHQSAIFQRIHHVQRDNKTSVGKESARERAGEKVANRFSLILAWKETERWNKAERKSECSTNIIKQPSQMHHHLHTGMKSSVILSSQIYTRV